MKKFWMLFGFSRGSLSKLVLKMKLLTFLMFAVFAVSAADSYSQVAKFSFKLKDATVREVFDHIEENSEFILLYNEKWVDVNRRVDINVKNETLEKVLDQTFKGTRNVYKIYDRQVVILEDEKAEIPANVQRQIVEMQMLQFQQKEITGKVTDAGGLQLPGVSVIIKGTTIGTVTNADGEYSLTNIPENATLQFSFVGMRSQEIEVGNQTNINVTLLEEAIGIEEVVAVGYGTQRRGSITGAISSVSESEIQESVVTDAGSALQGRAAGVMALSAGNRPGDGVTIRIRGRRSLTASNEPLYIIDGIPFSGNINEINPRDIKSMEILKDASATAIYGSRGANGVILISTNRGGDYPTIVSYNGYYGVTTPLGKPDMMNGEEFTRMKQSGETIYYIDRAAEEDAIERGVSTDWIDLVVSPGYKQNHQLSVRGGTASTAFNISANIFDEQAVVENQNFLRQTLRINFDHHVSDKFRIGTSLQISDQLINAGSNMYGLAVGTTPLAEPYDSEGNLTDYMLNDPLRWNPLYDLEPGVYVDEREKLGVFGNIFLEYDIFDNLSYRMNYGPEYQRYNHGQFRGTMSNSSRYDVPDAYKGETSTFSHTFENIFTFLKEFNEDHSLRATGVFSTQQYTSTNTTVNVEGLPYEHQLYHNLSTAETILGYNSNLTEWGIMSFMGRINYNLMNKYLFTITGRYDGSSRLAEGKKWGFFPSAAFLWNIGNEQFMANEGILSELKLRVSYGVTGNTAISPYQTQGGLSRSVYSFGDVAGYGYRPSSIANPDLRWEKSAMANIGIDFAIGNAIRGSFEVYQTNTSDLLLQRMLPISSGFGDVLENIGKTKNRGWELDLSGNILTTSQLTWRANLQFFGNREQIVDLYGTKEDDVGNRWFIGEPLTVRYNYEKVGIWQLDEADVAASYGYKPGQIKIRDVNDDKLFNHNDMQILGTDIPFATIGLGSNLTYRNFDFSFLLLSIFGHTIYNNFEVSHASLQGRYGNLNVDYWTPDNPTNNHPRPDGSLERPYFSDTRGYYPGDFLKVKTIQLGYSLDDNLLKRLGARTIKIYVNADTPFIFSHLRSNLDPESYGGAVSSDTPSVRTFSLGLNIDF